MSKVIFDSDRAAAMEEQGINITTENGSIHFYNGPPPMLMIDRLHTFKKYAYPITTGFGLIGNTIIFYLFTRTRLKQPSTARYLAACAVADLGYLLTTFLFNLDIYGVPFVDHVGPCQILTFGNNVFLFLSSWYLTAVMVEKYIGVSWPRNKYRMCTVFRAKCVIIFLAILAITCYLYTTWFYGVIPPGPTCTLFYFDEGIVAAWRALSRIDAIVNFAVPYIIILLTTCLIAYRTWCFHKRSRSAGERFLRRTKVSNTDEREFKTTPLLILLASCTLLFSTPNNSSSLRRVFIDFIPTPADRYMMDVFHFLHMLNSAIKLIVYIASSNAFVRELAKQLRMIATLFRKKDSNNHQACLQDAEHSNIQACKTVSEGCL